MAGKKTASTATTVYNGIQVQSAISGRAIPLGWGTFSCSANLLWYGAFKATPVNDNQGGGKGGPAQAQSYSYSASVVLGICAGPIRGIRTVYADQNVYVDDGEYVNGVFQSETESALAQAGLGLIYGFLGAEQEPWDYLTVNFPDQAIGYSGIALAVGQNLALSDGASLQNYAFEVQSTLHDDGSDDANPADILNDFLPRIPFWSSGLIGDLSNYHDYCEAMGLLLSPVLDDQRTVQDFLTEVMQATNANCYWSEGLLKVTPYGDTAVGEWLPDLTPVFDLTDDDFVPSSAGDDPVQVDRTRGADAYNYVQVEYLQRSNAYNTQIAIGIDPANIDQFGRLPNTSPYSLHSICADEVAPLVAQLLVQRSANVRATYKFSLPCGKADLLEPMDLVTLTSPSSNLNQVLVRLTKLQEKIDDNGPCYACEAEEMLVGSAHAEASTMGAWSGYTTDFNIAPGTVGDVALINPTRALTGGDYELWLGATGTSDAWGGAQIWLSFDGGDSYGYSGQDVVAPVRLGVLNTILAATPDPDLTEVLEVDLTASGGVLLAGSQADADAGVTLSLVDDELISYAGAELVGSFTYDLSYLRRGQYGSTVAAHDPGGTFVRLDQAIAKVRYQAQQVDAIVYVKFLSYNVYGKALQELSAADPYPVILNPGAPPVIDIISTDTQNVGGRPSSQIINELATALAAIEALSQQGAALQADVQTQAVSLLQQVMNSINLKSYFDDIVWVGDTDVKTAVLNETNARIDGDDATVETISLIGAKSMDGLSFILNDLTVEISPGLALGTYITNIASNIGSNAAAISSEATTRATADSATATLISLIGAQNGGGTAFVINTSTAQITGGTSLASYIAGVSSSLGTNSSAITSEASTRASADTTLASSISTVSTTVAGHTSSISSLFSSVSGITSSWGLSINSNGYITGLQLVGGSTTSTFTILASDLIFTDNAGTLTAPFYISGGVVYADTIVVSVLRAGVVYTSNIVGGAVSNTYLDTTSTLFTGNNSWQSILSRTITLTTAADIFIFLNAGQGFLTVPAAWNLEIQVDGVNAAAPSQGTGYNESASIFAAGSYAAGSHTVTFWWNGDTNMRLTRAQMLTLVVYR